MLSQLCIPTQSVGTRNAERGNEKEHVFAAWVKSVGLGNGTSVLTDPDPGTEC